MRLPALVITLALIGCATDPKPSSTAQDIESVGPMGLAGVDNDNDGFTNDVDCNDANNKVYPGAPERCDSLDNDCDGVVDDNVVTTWYFDADADKYGNPTRPYAMCNPAWAFLVATNTDCNDNVKAINPGATEVCDSVDNDCDAAIDEGVTTTFYQDADGDDHGLAGVTTQACAEPGGYASAPGDCDDADAAIFPGATEVCDAADNDCDGDTDEPGATGSLPFYADIDGDGYGDVADSVVLCEAPEGYVASDADCDDADAAISPAATELCDGIDNDCDGITDQVDADGDGFVSPDCAGGDDCDDADPAFHPGAAEVWYDGLDQACDGDNDYDADGDGHLSDVHGGDDCDDAAGGVSPSAIEVCDDGIDQDCDGTPTGCGPFDLLADSDADAIFTGAAGDRAAQGEPGFASAGDFNGDGYGDLAVGALRNDAAGTDAGAAYVLFGPLSGTSALSAADLTVTGEAEGDNFGRAVSTAGDVDGDGYDDLLIGAIGQDAGGADSGAIYLLHGPATGTLSASAADAIFTGQLAGDIAGELGDPGDYNGDGYADVFVGAQLHDGGRGAAYLFWGPVSGAFDLGDADAVLEGEAATDEAAASLGSAGDVDGDGIDDLLVASRSEDSAFRDAGAVYLLHGPIGGSTTLSGAHAKITGAAIADELGAGVSVSSAGDLNNDGYADLVIGARKDDTAGVNAGAAYVFMGPVAGGTASLGSAFARLTGEAAADQTGDSAHGPGDVDGDGYDDLLIGSGFADGGAANAGAVYLWRGPVAAGTASLADAHGTIWSTGADDRARGRGVGDLDGDGKADIALGAQNNDLGGADAGALFLFSGSGI
jgi:hypothetical protein